MSSESEEHGLSIRLFGRFEVEREGIPIEPKAWGRRKTQTLLKFLLLRRGRVVSTDQILDALYPQNDPQKAAGNLRTRISQLRRALEPALRRGAESQYVLHVSPGHYCFSEDASCRTDTELFERDLEEARELSRQRRWGDALRRYEEALSLYRGDLLEEDRYEEWTLAPRERYRRLFHEALEDCADLYARLRRFAPAIAAIRRVLEDDPCCESAYRRLMLYESSRGDTRKALEAYEKCASELRAHFGCEPSPETQALRNRIRKGRVAPFRHPRARSR